MPTKIQDFISKIFAKKEVEDEGKALISIGSNQDEFSFGNYTPPNYEKLEAAFRNYSVFASLNLLAQSIYGSGFTLEGDNEKANKLCEPIQNLKSFKPRAVEGILNALALGDGYNEIVWNEEKNNIVLFKIVDTKTLAPKWDRKGEITKYIQTTVGGISRPLKLKPEEICFFRLFRIGDNIHGIALVETVYRLLEIRNDMWESVADIFRYMAMPPLHVIKEGAKSKKEIEKVKLLMKDFRRKNFIATSEKYKFELMEVKKNLPELSKYFDIINRAISTGLRVSEDLLSGKIATSTIGSAQALMEINADEMAFIRGKLACILEEQIFKPLCIANDFEEKDVPKVIWKADISEDPKLKSEILVNKLKVIEMLLTQELVTKEEVAEKVKSIIEKL